jgi:hypothetical protein
MSASIMSLMNSRTQKSSKSSDNVSDAKKNSKSSDAAVIVNPKDCGLPGHKHMKTVFYDNEPYHLQETEDNEGDTYTRRVKCHDSPYVIKPKIPEGWSTLSQDWRVMPEISRDLLDQVTIKEMNAFSLDEIIRKRPKHTKYSYGPSNSELFWGPSELYLEEFNGLDKKTAAKAWIFMAYNRLSSNLSPEIEPKDINRMIIKSFVNRDHYSSCSSLLYRAIDKGVSLDSLIAIVELGHEIKNDVLMSISHKIRNPKYNEFCDYLIKKSLISRQDAYSLLMGLRHADDTGLWIILLDKYKQLEINPFEKESSYYHDSLYCSMFDDMLYDFNCYCEEKNSQVLRKSSRIVSALRLFAKELGVDLAIINESMIEKYQKELPNRKELVKPIIQNFVYNKLLKNKRFNNFELLAFKSPSEIDYLENKVKIAQDIIYCWAIISKLYFYIKWDLEKDSSRNRDSILYGKDIDLCEMSIKNWLEIIPKGSTWYKGPMIDGFSILNRSSCNGGLEYRMRILENLEEGNELYRDPKYKNNSVYQILYELGYDPNDPQESPTKEELDVINSKIEQTVKERVNKLRNQLGIFV